MWNIDLMQKIDQQRREERLQKAKIFWELERSKDQAPKPFKTTFWLEKLQAFLQRQTAKLQRKNA